MFYKSFLPDKLQWLTWSNNNDNNNNNNNNNNNQSLFLYGDHS